MKFSLIERKILRFVYHQFPIAHEPDPEIRVVAIGEIPLPTECDIHRECHCTLDEAKAAIQKLKTYQCIAERYLCSTDEFREQRMPAGEKVRHLALVEPKGIYVYQITKFGQEAIGDFWYEKAKKHAGSVFEECLKKYVPLILAFLFGSLATVIASYLANRH